VSKQLSLKIVPASAGVTISNVAATSIISSGAVIAWTTDKAANSQVEYGPTASYGSSAGISSAQTTSHRVTITGLNPGTTYNYRAVSSISGYTARSSNYSFKTLDVQPQVSPLAVTTNSLSGGISNQTYSQTLTAAGGKTPYFWSLSQGILPPGLQLSPAGQISGKPTSPGVLTFTIKVEDSSVPKLTITKQLSISVTGILGAQTCPGKLYTGTNLCQARQMNCSASTCSQYVPAINQYAGGAASANLLKAIMIKESACRVGVQSNSNPPSCGLMQLKPSTANIYRNRCGIESAVNITCDWLKSPANASASICIAAEYVRALAQTSCGSSTRNLAAGYNGGSGACNQSQDCNGQTSCDGSPVKRWECLYDNPEHTVCNEGYDETRDYATKVLYCYNNPGF
ncbi:MAG TPA: fibronectin type III domain-containing protein, partial [Candidatus Paceibacterota bacterium]